MLSPIAVIGKYLGYICGIYVSGCSSLLLVQYYLEYDTVALNGHFVTNLGVVDIKMHRNTSPDLTLLVRGIGLVPNITDCS